MEEMIANGEFLETTEFSANLYGTRLLFVLVHPSCHVAFFLIRQQEGSGRRGQYGSNLFAGCGQTRREKHPKNRSSTVVHLHKPA